jgi:hypothetical protein
MAPARGGDRTDGRRWYPVPVGRVLVGLGIAALAVAGGSAGAAGPGHSGQSGPTLTLLAPPSIAGPAAPFALRLGVSGAVSHSDLSLGITVYRSVSDPTEFDETLGGTPVEPIDDRSGAIALSSLAADPVDSQNGVDLSVPVTAGGTAGAGTGPFTADLKCPLGSCGGVYPVQLTLTDTLSHVVTSRLLTYLVYTDPSADIEPLRFALVLPLVLPPAPDSSSGSAPAVTSSSLDTLSGLMNAITGPQSVVPLTIAPGPATVGVLAADHGPRARAALASLVSLTDETDRETLCGPFVPVDANELVTTTTGGTSELARQVRRGAEVLATVPGLRTADCTTDNAWVTNGTLDPPALAALAALGYTDIVVPPSAVAGPTPSTTPTRRFTLGSPSHPGNAMLSDPESSDRLRPTPDTDPALAADQILAGLELDYYEAPNTERARGVVAVPPTTGSADPSVVADLLHGLQGNPMVDAVTLATLFSDVPVGGTVGTFTQPSSRRPAPVAAADGLPALAIAAARLQWTGFASTVSHSSVGRAETASLDDLLLEAESQELTPSQQRAAVGRFDDTFRRQLDLLSITSREVRLTARTGSVPITVIKNAPYPVEAVLTVTSDKIAFSTGGAQVPDSECRAPVITESAGRSSVSTLCTFAHGTNAVYIEMRSRVSGDFRMSVTLNSPQSDLLLASGQLTVRSMSTSAVAIALTVVAAAVLFGWWARTLWRNRRTRRGAHRQRDTP